VVSPVEVNDVLFLRRFAQQSEAGVQTLMRLRDGSGLRLHRRLVAGPVVVARVVPLLGRAVDKEIAHQAARQRTLIDEPNQRTEHVCRVASPNIRRPRCLPRLAVEVGEVVISFAQGVLVRTCPPAVPIPWRDVHTVVYALIRVCLLPPHRRQQLDARKQERLRREARYAQQVVLKRGEVVRVRPRPGAHHAHLGLQKLHAHAFKILDHFDQAGAEPPKGCGLVAVDEEPGAASFREYLCATRTFPPEAGNGPGERSV